MYNSVLSLPSTLYALCYMFFHLHSTLYILPATLFNLPSSIYHLPSKPIYALRTSYAPRSTIYPLSPSAWKVIGIFLICLKIFLNLLTKTSKQHKGRLLVVVSFFVYFRPVSSLSETSSGNGYNQH